MSEALAASGRKTKKETVEEAFRLLIGQKNQAKIRELKGKLRWEGDLDAMRTDFLRDGPRRILASSF
jgi:Arc/MetJ family transcription regulator